MSSSHYLAILVYLQLSTAIIGHENLNASCIVQFDESKLADVLHLIREPAINTVEIILTVASANRTRVFPEMKWPWTNEIGRTLISLTSRAKATIFSSCIFTAALDVGMETVSIEVTEETIGCLPTGKNGYDRVFSELLEKLFSHIEKEENKDNYYKLCRPHDIEGPVQFNCCRIIGDGKLTICADYSSIVLDFAVIASIAAAAIFSTLALPLLLEHILNYPDTTSYKTSGSHMSLTSIVSMVFFEGDDIAKSFFRRCFFVGLTIAVFYPANFFNNLIFSILYGTWAVSFCFVDGLILPYIKKMKKTKKEELKFRENLISGITIPISLPFDFYKNSVEDDESCWNDCYCGVCVVTFFLLLISIPLALFCLAKFVIFDFMLRFFFPSTCKCDGISFPNITEAVIRVLTLTIIVIFTGSIILLVLSLTVGLILNSESLNPFFAPAVTLMIFFWKHWQFSVEAPCLQLKTLTIDVCKEKAKIDDTYKSGIDSNNQTASTTCCADCCSCCCDSCNPFLDFLSSCCCQCDSDDNNNQENGDNDENYKAAKKILAIKFDMNTGEAMISKKLYEEVSKQILPLSDLLFRFFGRLLFVAIYAGIMLIVLILGKESGVSGTLQAISAIVAILIPFIFDTIYADHHLAQKNSNNMAMRERLQHIIWIVYKQERNVLVVLLKNSTTNVEKLLQSLKTIKKSLGSIEKSLPAIEPLRQEIEKCWEPIEASLESINDSLLETEKSWGTIKTSWKKIKKPLPTIDLLRQTIGQSSETIKASSESIEQAWQKINQTLKSIEEPLPTNEQSQHANEQAWQKREKAWQTIKESLESIEQAWQEINETLKSIGKPLRTNEQSQHANEQAWQEIKASLKSIKDPLQKIEKLQKAKESALKTINESLVSIEQSRQSIKQTWQTIEQSWKTITQTWETIVDLWPTIKQSSSTNGQSWRTNEQSRKRIDALRRTTEQSWQKIEEMWGGEHTEKTIMQAIKNSGSTIKKLLQEIQQWLVKSRRINKLLQEVKQQLSPEVTNTGEKREQSWQNIELSKLWQNIELLKQEMKQSLQTVASSQGEIGQQQQENRAADNANNYRTLAGRNEPSSVA